MDKWIIDMAMVINQFNHKLWGGGLEGETCHQSEVMRWTREQGVIVTIGRLSDPVSSR